MDYNYKFHTKWLIIFSIIVGIVLFLELWVAYHQFEDDRIKNTQNKSKYQNGYPISKSFGSQNCR